MNIKPMVLCTIRNFIACVFLVGLGELHYMFITSYNSASFILDLSNANGDSIIDLINITDSGFTQSYAERGKFQAIRIK